MASSAADQDLNTNSASDSEPEEVTNPQTPVRLQPWKKLEIKPTFVRVVPGNIGDTHPSLRLDQNRDDSKGLGG